MSVEVVAGGPRGVTGRRRVLVLGGGCGGVAAAWALSRTPSLRRRFDVTLVQAGWRLGGKGATGRDAAHGNRILEHGLHLWLGFYRQAFGMMRDVYDAWRDAPASGPLRSLETAFTPLYDVVLCGGDDAAPDYWRLRLPALPGRPWDPPAASAARAWAGVAAGWARAVHRSMVAAPGERAWTVARVATMSGLSAAIVRGLARDVAGRGEAGWAALDEHDLRAWLRRHGATAAQADAPPVRALYDLGFAYPDGHAGPGRGAMAAGAGLRALLQIFAGYRGAPFFRMNAGMGDTVFAPLYDVLRARGVRFKFFHRVESLEVARGGVGRVELAVQAALAGEEYAPLLDLGEARAWPDAPRRAQLAAVAPGDLEADAGAALGRLGLERGRDFDDVVLAIPSTVHARIARGLMDASPRYRAMVEHTCAVPTVAAQWWFARPPGAAGAPHAASVLTGVPGLFRTCADMTALLDAEPWDTASARPAALAYLCNVAPPELFDATDRAAASALVAARMREWARASMARAWPRGAHAAREFDPRALHAAPGAAEPWSAQYARANVAGWERYVLTPPGSVRYRLAPGDSGFDNLVLAGDWTRNAVNGGSVEGAVSSGVAAADALIARAEAARLYELGP